MEARCSLFLPILRKLVSNVRACEVMLQHTARDNLFIDHKCIYFMNSYLECAVLGFFFCSSLPTLWCSAFSMIALFMHKLLIFSCTGTCPVCAVNMSVHFALHTPWNSVTSSWTTWLFLAWMYLNTIKKRAFESEWFPIIGSASALPILCVRCARWERERERERERDRERERRERERERERVRDGSDVTLVALKLAVNFAPFLAKNLHLSIGEEFCTFSCQKICTLVSPLLLNGAELTLAVAKNVAFFETVRVLRFASVKWRDRRSKHRNKRSNFRLHRPSSNRKKESN